MTPTPVQRRPGLFKRVLCALADVCPKCERPMRDPESGLSWVFCPTPGCDEPYDSESARRLNRRALAVAPRALGAALAVLGSLALGAAIIFGALALHYTNTVTVFP